jgi:transcriptional regulator with XRE-family HTH domain
VSFEYRKLRGRIVEKYGTNGNFAEKINVSLVTVSNKLRGVTQFSQDDIILWCEALEIPLEESGSYFFA